MEIAQAPARLPERVPTGLLELWNPYEGQLGVGDSVGQQVGKVCGRKTKFHLGVDLLGCSTLI